MNRALADRAVTVVLHQIMAVSLRHAYDHHHGTSRDSGVTNGLADLHIMGHSNIIMGLPRGYKVLPNFRVRLKGITHGNNDRCQQDTREGSPLRLAGANMGFIPEPSTQRGLLNTPPA